MSENTKKYAPKEIGRRIEERRKAKDMTQQQLADAAETTQATIARTEKGLHTINVRSFVLLAEALKVDPWDLIRPNEPAKPSLAPAPLPFADLEKELRKLGHGHALNFLKGWITEVREFNQILQERQAGKDPSQGETD